MTGEVCLDERKIEEVGLMGVTPPNSRNLAADDASWLPMVLPAVYAVYKDRRFGRYLGNVDYTGNPTKCYFVKTRVGTRLVGSHVILFGNPSRWLLLDTLYLVNGGGKLDHRGGAKRDHLRAWRLST